MIHVVETPEKPTRPTVVLDARALAALAHPLRSRLLRLLRIDGPATASGLAARAGESSGLTSYHLRKLADVGLVEEDPGRGNRRERWWRPAHEVTSWSTTDFLGNASAYRATQELRRGVYHWQLGLLENWLADEAEWSEEWVAAAETSDDVLELTPTQLKAMTAEIWDVVQRYRAAPPRRPEHEVTARVMWLAHAFPIRDELPR